MSQSAFVRVSSADGGKLYNGIGPERVMAMRHLLVHADVMVPNMTEASFLTGIRPGQETGTDREIRELVEGLREISGRSGKTGKFRRSGKPGEFRESGKIWRRSGSDSRNPGNTGRGWTCGECSPGMRL